MPNKVSSYELLMDTLKFGNIEFKVDRMQHTDRWRFVAREPNSGEIAAVETNMFEMTQYDMAAAASNVHHIQEDLMYELLKSPRSRPYVRQMMFDRVQYVHNGATYFDNHGSRYGPYPDYDTAYAAWVLLTDYEDNN